MRDAARSYGLCIVHCVRCIAHLQRENAVLRNLLENAWKYSGDEKVISVAAGAEGGEVWVAVRDNGIGLDAKDRERIFKQFYRVDQRLAREREGLGIGLSIVQRLVRAMHGRVTVESAPGEGSEFKIWLQAES